MDKGRELADKELLKLERSLSKEYATAKKEMRAKYNKFMRNVEEKDKEKRALLAKGAITRADYDEWRANQTYRAKWFKDMMQTLAKDQTAVNKRAAAIINGVTSGVYAEQFNYGTYMVEKAAKVDTAFTLYDKGAVRNLNAKAEIKVTKDIAWNNRKINSALMQGILQGESIPDIANRLAKIPDMNAGAAVRNARTLMTSAENEGRLDSFERAAGMGIKLKKTWIATLDDKVRASHAELDGETVEIDEPFSNGLMYPADPSGDDPAEIYNCRCTMIVQIAGFERDVTDMGLRPAKIGSYEAWKASHTKKGVKNGNKHRRK
jgi:SPP1 gp7 family putative phage head morphogenesis protein